jgi:RNA polymerase sigma-70 factor, ECF subfamily
MLEPPSNDADLGDPALWVDRYGDALLQYAVTRVGDRETAEDLVQETFLSAFKARRDFDHRAAFSTWLIAILRRKIIDHYRKDARTLVTTDAELDEVAPMFDRTGHWTVPPANWRSTPASQAENSEFWQVVRRCLADLPRHLAQAFELRELGLATVQEASEIAGITPRNLSVRLHRSRLLLRSCLEQKWFAAEAVSEGDHDANESGAARAEQGRPS